MQALRNASFLARLVLAWFALSLGVALASPLMKPASVELVCSAGGAIQLVAIGDTGTQPAPNHTLDCPLCLVAGAPGPFDVHAARFESRPVLVLSFDRCAPLAAAAAAPLPARGPPLSAAL
jgi:hypothetical protein